jgi:hypothetical protein
MVAIQAGDTDSPVGTLSCTLRAAKTVNAVFGSYSAAGRRLAELDMSAFFEVAAAGLGKTKPEERDAVEAAVFTAGLQSLLMPFNDYLGLLANGGKPIKTPGSGDSKPGEA